MLMERIENDQIHACRFKFVANYIKIKTCMSHMYKCDYVINSSLQ